MQLSLPPAKLRTSTATTEDAPPCAIKLLVSNNMAGSLIGKGGATIQNVQLQSGATVRVSTSGMYLPGTQVRLGGR
jgi:RNA-binding protein Nova